MPPLTILAGGLVFGLLMPLLAGAAGAAVLCAFAFSLAFALGAGACRLVDHTSRSMFLRERAGGLPPARLLPARTHR